MSSLPTVCLFQVQLFLVQSVCNDTLTDWSRHNVCVCAMRQCNWSHCTLHSHWLNRFRLVGLANQCQMDFEWTCSVVLGVLMEPYKLHYRNVCACIACTARMGAMHICLPSRHTHFWCNKQHNGNNVTFLLAVSWPIQRLPTCIINCTPHDCHFIAFLSLLSISKPFGLARVVFVWLESCH